MGIGVGVRALDVKRKNLGAWGKKFAWIGHGAWHILTGMAIAVLIWCGGDVEEDFCKSWSEKMIKVTYRVGGKAVGFDRKAMVGRLRESFDAGEWSLGFIPPYPLGHAQIEDHDPWSRDVWKGVVVVAIFLCVSRQAFRGAYQVLGSGSGGEDSDRFCDILYFSTVHVGMTVFAAMSGVRENVGWGGDWWR